MAQEKESDQNKRAKTAIPKNKNTCRYGDQDYGTAREVVNSPTALESNDECSSQDKGTKFNNVKNDVIK